MNTTHAHAPTRAPLLDIDDIATRLKVSPDHVRRLIRSGALIGADVSLGGGERATLRFDPDEVEAFIVSRRTRGAL